VFNVPSETEELEIINFLVTHPMTDQRCLTSATAGPILPHRSLLFSISDAIPNFYSPDDSYESQNG
jgi:hypothetical protein